jgi:hypothetical protein
LTHSYSVASILHVCLILRYITRTTMDAQGQEAIANRTQALLLRKIERTHSFTHSLARSRSCSLSRHPSPPPPPPPLPLATQGFFLPNCVVSAHVRFSGYFFACFYCRDWAAACQCCSLRDVY